MDYTKNRDTTITNRMLKFKPSSNKLIVTCNSCLGSIIQYEEDTVYNCKFHMNKGLTRNKIQ